MEHLYKNFQIKSADDENGTISGYFSTYDRIPDSYGDVIEKGAFTDTIKARKDSGHPFPLCWNHDLNQIIGFVNAEDINDDEHGPLMTAHFFNSALAQEKRELVKAGVVYQFSFAYDIVGMERPTKDEERTGIYQILTKLDLFEISVVPIPANPRAEVTEIKSGRRNSASDTEKLSQAIDLIRDVLGEVDDTEDGQNEGKDEPDVNAAAEEQKASNPERDNLLAYIKSMKTETEGKDNESEV